jgi:hypothetical protein
MERQTPILHQLSRRWGGFLFITSVYHLSKVLNTL